VELTTITVARATAAKVMARWTAIKTVDVPALNAKLKAAHLGTLWVRFAKDTLRRAP